MRYIYPRFFEPWDLLENHRPRCVGANTMFMLVLMGSELRIVSWIHVNPFWIHVNPFWIHVNPFWILVNPFRV